MEQKLRAPRMSIWLLAILAALVASAHASAINLDRSTYKGCVQRCSKDNSLFSQDSSSSGLTGLFRKSRATGQEQSSVQFELGKTYSYQVNTWNEARTIYALNEQQNTRDQLVRVQATALLTPVSDCELSLQLQNIKLNLKDGQSIEGQSDVDEFIRQLEVPILFGYQNGVVSEVCTDSNEESSALNIKKSIISAFQTTPNLSSTEQVKVIEPDFNGECETEYSVEKMSWNKFLVTKRKDLNKCDNPAEQVETYRNWKNTLLKHNTNSVAQCTQTIQGQQIQSAQCQSVRTINTVLPHFTVQLVSNVVIESNEVLSAEQQSAQVPARWTRHAHRLMMAQPSTGIFSQKRRSNKRLSELADGRVQLKNVLDQICDDIQTNGQRVSLKTAQYVHILADTLKQSSQEDVHFVWQNIVQNHNICGAQAKKLKDIFVDTAASVMNRNSALIVRDELVKYIEKAQQEKDQFSLKKARYLATLVAFSFEPTAEAVRQIVPELLEKVNDAQIVLSLSALVKKTREELNDAQLLESLYQTVLRKVLARYSHDQETEIVRLLNALENIEPQTVVSGQEQLVKLTSDKRLFESIRVAAIKSVQHIEMQAQLRQTLVKIFTDRSESNEIRIAAYRSLVQSQTTVQELRQILAVTQQEQNDDVRNYVFSHQKNLRTTNDLKKRALLPLDAPLFPEPQSIANFLVSRNFEYFFVNPRTEAGAIVEADLIMESDSRVPRAVTFNLTVPVAEQQIPIVELTIRQQGLERSLIERLEKLKQLKSPAAMLREVRRMVQSQKVRQQPQDDLQGKLQMLINVDGKNVYVWDSVECQKEQQNDQFDTILAQLYKQLPIQIDETMVIMPLKHRVRLPTSNGIPINFELNTTLIASLETTIKGHQDVENLLEMHIKPTLVAELGVGLEVDLPFEGKKAEQVQFRNRLITAPNFHVHFQNEPHARQLRVKILMPENEQTIVRFETLYNNEQDDGLQNDTRKAILQEQRQSQWLNGTNRVQEKKCLPVLDRALGITYCVKTFSVDDLKAALVTNRSSRTIFLAEIQLIKTDLQMEGIELVIELPKLFTPKSVLNELKFVFHFDTPNSKVNRRINTELVVRMPSQQTTTDKYLVQVAIDSPVKQISGQVAVLNQENHKGIVIELTADSERQFLLEANALVAVQDPTNTQVKIQLRVQPTAQSNVTKLEGELVVNAQSENKSKKVQLRLLANEQQVLDLLLNQTSSHLASSNDPIQTETKGKIEILGGEHVFLFRDNLQEVSKGVFQGKTLIQVAESSSINRSMPKKVQFDYTFKKLDNATPRLPFIGRLGLNWFAQFVSSLEHFKHELIVEADAFGQIQHTGLVAINSKNEWQLKSRLQLEQSEFTFEAELMSNSSELRSLNVKLESGKFNQLQLEAKFKGEQKHYELKFEDQLMKLHIRIDRNGAFGTVQQWSIMAGASQREKNGQKWLIQSEHQCHQFTTIQLDTPLVRGNIEVRLDSNQIHIDLKGDQQWQGLDHKTDAQLDLATDKWMIKSVTLRQGKPFVFVDAELYSSLNRTSSLKLEFFDKSNVTEDSESPHGENPWLAIEVSFQESELFINRFGQWRRDFKLEAVLKCYSKPTIEMSITSRHLAGVHQIDGTLRNPSQEYVAKWLGKFDDLKKNWNMNILIQEKGVKQFDLHVECVTKQIDEDQTLKVLKANVTGVEGETSLLNLTIRRQASNPLGIIEVVQWEVSNQHERVLSFDLFIGVRDVHQSGNRTGVKLAAHDKTIFGLTHITNDRVDGQNNQTSMVRLELIDQTEYVLRNEIEYSADQPDEIKSIQSELIRKQNSAQRIYLTRIIYDEDKKRGMKVIRVEIQSDRIASTAYSGGHRIPLIVEIRYNFPPNSYQCEKNSIQAYDYFPYGDSTDSACWQFEVLVSHAKKQQHHHPQQNQFELQSEQQFDIKIGANYFKFPIDTRHTNRTIRFNIAAQKQNDVDQSDLVLPINFTFIDHASVHAIGLAWKINNDEEIGTTIDLQEDRFSKVVKGLAASNFCSLLPLLPPSWQLRKAPHECS